MSFLILQSAQDVWYLLRQEIESSWHFLGLQHFKLLSWQKFTQLNSLSLPQAIFWRGQWEFYTHIFWAGYSSNLVPSIQQVRAWSQHFLNPNLTDLIIFNQKGYFSCLEAGLFNRVGKPGRSP